MIRFLFSWLSKMVREWQLTKFPGWWNTYWESTWLWPCAGCEGPGWRVLPLLTSLILQLLLGPRSCQQEPGGGKGKHGWGRNSGVAILSLIYNVVCVPCSSTCHLLAMCTLLACSSKAVLGTLITVTNGGHESSLLSFLSLTCVAKTSMAFSNCKVQSE